MTSIRMRGKGSVVIDGKSFTGNNISITNGKVTIDGVTQDGELVGDVNITVNGDVESIDNSSGKVVANNIGVVKTVSGDVNCGDVSNGVQTVSGDVKCKSVGGNIKTVSGDIDKRF